MTDSNAHIASNLPIRKSTISIDEDTAALFHYDITANNYSGLIKPYGSYVDESTILYYDMADTFTNSNGTYVIDKSENGNFGKVNGATVCDGRNGMALNFDGNNQYVLTDFFPSIEKLGTEFTWSFWKRYNIFEANTGSSGNNDSSSSRLYTQIVNASGDLRIGIGDWFATVATLPSVKIWYFITTTYDNGKVKVYIDGILKHTQDNVNFSGTSKSPVSIGRGYSDARFLNGSVDKFTILNRIMSDQEVLEGYNEGIYTLRSDGRYGGSIAIEEGTDNLLTDAYTFKATMQI